MVTEVVIQRTDNTMVTELVNQRTGNTMVTEVVNQRTGNTMVKRKRTQGQTMIYKTPHRKHTQKNQTLY